jgi:hypothetical protein
VETNERFPRTLRERQREAVKDISVNHRTGVRIRDRHHKQHVELRENNVILVEFPVQFLSRACLGN